MIERESSLHKDSITTPEVKQTSLEVVLVHMVGEGRIDLQKPIGPEILATHLQKRK